MEKAILKPSVTLPKAIMSRLPETNGVELWETEERGEQLEATVGLSPYFFSSWNLPKKARYGCGEGCDGDEGAEQRIRAGRAFQHQPCPAN